MPINLINDKDGDEHDYSGDYSEEDDVGLM